MKKKFNLIVWISSISILLLSCSKEETENNKKPNDDSNMVTVSLGLTGDILEVEETPLSKATETADIYGVQIYSSPKDEDNYQPYGYGIFIDKSKMQVKLFKDRKYKFEMTVFPDGEYYIYEGEKHTQTGVRPPINDPVIRDSIKYCDYELGELSKESRYTDAETCYSTNRPPFDRYYGKLIDYTPTENSTIKIDLKRVIVGLTFKVKGLTEQSSLKIDIEGFPIVETKGDRTIEEMAYNSLMCLRGEKIEQYSSYYTDKWFENPVDEVPFTFTWTNGERTESFMQTVTLKRKMNYTFQITIPETFLVSNGINVTEEDDMWDDDVAVDNIYFGDLTIENAEDLQAFKNARYTKVTGNLTVINVNRIVDDLYGLQYVGGNLRILATQENVMNGNWVLSRSFNELKEVGGNFEISSIASNSLNEFNYLETVHLVKVGGDIILKNLPALKDYCDLKTVLQNHTGQFIVSGNAYNPTKEQILAGECSMQ